MIFSDFFLRLQQNVPHRTNTAPLQLLQGRPQNEGIRGERQHAIAVENPQFPWRLARRRRTRRQPDP